MSIYTEVLQTIMNKILKMLSVKTFEGQQGKKVQDNSCPGVLYIMFWFVNEMHVQHTAVQNVGQSCSLIKEKLSLQPQCEAEILQWIKKHKGNCFS